MTLNGLVAADSVIIPLQCEFFSLEGLSQLDQIIRHVKSNENPSLEIEGLLFTMLDPRLNVTGQVVNEVKKAFPNQVFETTIPRNVRLSEAPSFGEPIIKYDRTSKGAYAYTELAKEIISNN